MTPGAVLSLICVSGIFQAGLTALIQTQRTLMAAEGEEVTLNCRLVESKEVLQVTWQKLLPEGEVNLATNNKFFGQRVNAGFQGNVEFKDAGLQSCSIVIRKVTEVDEGCYRCLFNTYPDGALTGSTCLRLYELHEPVLHVGGSNSPEEAVVSCSATGRPAPTVTLSLLRPDLHLSNYSSVTVANANATFTVTATAVLSGLRGNNTQVGCAVRVLSGPQIEVFMMIPEVKPSPADDLNEESGSDNNFDVTWIIMSAVAVFVFLCLCVAAMIAVVKWKRNKSRPRGDSEDIKTPKKSSKDTHEPKTPLLQLAKEQLRQRCSTGKDRKSNNPKASPSAKIQRQLFSNPE